MNFFKKISLFFTYSSVIKSIKNELEMEFNARVDRISRIYTVLNIPVNLIEEPYNLRATDIDTLSKNYVIEFRRRITDFLVQRGLMELFDLYEIRKVDKYSYLLIFGFSLFDTRKWANSIMILSIILLILISISIPAFILIKTLL